jgi:hypothetical protein
MLSVHGMVKGGSGANSGVIFASNIANTISVEGSVIAGTGAGSGVIQVNNNLATVHIGGDLDNSAGPSSGNLTTPGNETGAIVAGKLGNVTVDGSVIQGRIVSTGAIGSVTIGKDFIGSSTRQALIVAGGVNTSDATIASVLVKGQAANAKVLGGWTRDVQSDGTVLYSPVNADAQIGSVEVDGNVQALDIVAGAMPGTFAAANGSTPRSFGDGQFGTSDDIAIANIGLGLQDNAAISSKIALVIFKGSVLTDAAARGIVAEQVDTVVVDGDLLPLTGGKDSVSVSPAVTNFKVLEVI